MPIYSEVIIEDLWIPLDRAKPHDGQYCLVWIDRDWQSCPQTLASSGRWLEKHQRFDHMLKDGEGTHWMPWPKAPTRVTVHDPPESPWTYAVLFQYDPAKHHTANIRAFILDFCGFGVCDGLTREEAWTRAVEVIPGQRPGIPARYRHNKNALDTWQVWNFGTSEWDDVADPLEGSKIPENF